MLSRFSFLLVPLAIAASCGGKLGTDPDGGNDGSASCNCPKGQTCQFPISEGCSATPTCMQQVACKGLPSCACDGTSVNTCGQGAPKPIAHGGPCNSPPPPPPDCGPSCEVCDLTGFAVTPQVAPNEATNACTSQDISAFVTACLSTSATSTTCNTWEQSTAGKGPCGACILTPITSAPWGPIVCDSSICTINTGGCIDIVSGQVPIENGTNGSCGDLTNASNECIDYACGSCTDASDSTACSQNAEIGSCKAYFDAAQNSSTCALFDAGTSACSPQSDSDWVSFVNVFCGTGP